MFIYLIVNHITGKYYVGQHKGTSLKKYLQKKLWAAKHQLYGSSHLFNSMRKHSKDAWSIHALLSDVRTRVELDAHEKDFIAFLKSTNPEYGYNICRGGEGFTGPHSDKTRRKMSIAHLGQKKSPEAIVKSALARRGLKRSLETITNIRCARERIYDMKGMTINGIEVLERVGNAKNRHTTWRCRCVCGKLFVVEGSNLRDRHTKSCGCLKRSTMLVNRNSRPQAKHTWIPASQLLSTETGTYLVCKRCGIVLRADGANKDKPCKGVTKITVRKRKTQNERKRS